MNTVQTMIERVPSDRYFGRTLDVWKPLRHEGWDVTALLAPDKKTVVYLACRQGEEGTETAELRLF